MMDDYPTPETVAEELEALAGRLRAEAGDGNTRIRGWENLRAKPHQLTDGPNREWAHSDTEERTLFLAVSFPNTVSPTADPPGDGAAAADVHPAVARHDTVIATDSDTTTDQ